MSGPEQVEWLRREVEEHDNFRAALSWSQTSPEYAEKGLLLGIDLQWLWLLRGWLREGKESLTAALSQLENTESTLLKASGLRAAGYICSIQEDYPEAERFYREALAGSRELQDENGIAHAIVKLGVFARLRGDYNVAQMLFEECLEIENKLGDKTWISTCKLNLGRIHLYREEYDEASDVLQEGLQLAKESENWYDIASLLSALGLVSWSSGKLESAIEYSNQELDIWNTLENQNDIASSLINLGLIETDRGELQKAEGYVAESLKILKESKQKEYTAWGFAALARLAYAKKDFPRSSGLFSAAEALLRSAGVTFPPALRTDIAAKLDSLQESLGGPIFEQISEEWARLPFDQVMGRALSSPPP